MEFEYKQIDISYLDAIFDMQKEVFEEGYGSKYIKISFKRGFKRGFKS